jgi:hypothetical protein
MTVTKDKTTKAKAVKTTTSKAKASKVAEANLSTVVEQVVSTVTITPEVESVSAYVAPSAVASREQVAARAYELWQAAAHVHGQDVAHWFAAELELKV